MRLFKWIWSIFSWCTVVGHIKASNMECGTISFEYVLHPNKFDVEVCKYCGQVFTIQHVKV